MTTARASRGALLPAFASIIWGQQRLVERAPVDPNPYRLVIPDSHFDDRAKIFVVPFSPDVPRVDSVLGEGASTVGVLRQQQVAVIVEVTHDRDRDAHEAESLDDRRHSRRGLIIVDCHPHQLAPRSRKLGDLPHGGGHIGRIGVGHRLDHNRMTRADRGPRQYRR